MANADEYAQWIVKNADKRGTPEFDIVSRAYQDARSAQPAESTSTLGQDIKQGAGNLVAGAVRGAGSIGATLLAPIDAAVRAVNGGKPVSVGGFDIAGQDRRQMMDAGLQSMGAEPDSWMYKGGKLGAEVAGTAGVGGMLAKPVQALSASRFGAGVEPVLDSVAAALKSGGFRVGELSGAGGVAARLGSGAAVGGASAGMVNPGDAGFGAAIGGGLPVAAVGIGKVANKLGETLRGGEISPEVRDLYAKAQQYGVDIPADRIANSKPLNAISAALNYVPFSGRAATEDKMVSQLNQALSRTFGQDSSNVTQALRRANAELGSKFDAVLQSNTVKITPEFKSALAEAENQATNELGQEAASIIHKQIANILTKGASGEIEGQAAYNIKKTLDRIGQNNTPEAFYARDLKKKLMEALNNSLGPKEAANFAKVRQQYGNMIELEKLAKNGADGEVSVARLANMKNINNQPMQDLADIAAQFVKAREGQHGAAQRAAAGAITFGLSGAPALVAGAGAGRGMNMLMNSKLAKNVVMNGAQPLIDNRLTELLQYGARSAPVVSAQ